MADVPKKEESSQEASSVKEPEADASTRQTVPAVLPQAALGSGSMEVFSGRICCLQGMARKAGPSKTGQYSTAFPAEEAEG